MSLVPEYIQVLHSHRNTVCHNFKSTCSQTAGTPLAAWTAVTESGAAWEGELDRHSIPGHPWLL